MAVDRCDVCRRKLDFWTDGNGHLTIHHPVGPCVPPEPKYQERKCAICKKPVPCSRPGSWQMTCSPKCAEALARLERRRQIRERYRRRHGIPVRNSEADRDKRSYRRRIDIRSQLQLQLEA